jgi:adenylate kinase family enzyme
MVFHHFPVQPLASLNGAPYRSRLVVILAPPGGGKGALVEGEGLPGFTHVEMSKLLCNAAGPDRNAVLQKEMDRAQLDGTLVPTKPFIVNLAKSAIRRNLGQDMYFDGAMRHPDELEYIPFIARTGFRLIVIKYDVDPHVCHERMIARGRPGEKDNEAIRNRRLEQYQHALITFEEIKKRGLADVFDLGDMTTVEKKPRRHKVAGILSAYQKK